MKWHFTHYKGSPPAAYAVKGKHAFKLPLFICFLFTWFEFEHKNLSSALWLYGSEPTLAANCCEGGISVPAQQVLWCNCSLNEVLKCISLCPSGWQPPEPVTCYSRASVGRLLGFKSLRILGACFNPFCASGSLFGCRNKSRVMEMKPGSVQETGSLEITWCGADLPCVWAAPFLQASFLWELG